MPPSRGLLVIASCSIAPAAARAQPARARGELRGTVVAAASGQPVALASVAVRGASDTALAGGATVRPDGTFRIEGLRPGRYTVRVRALSFAPLVRTVTIAATGGTVDLGRLALATVAAQLGGVQVKAQQDAATLTAGANTYQTKDLAAASGGTAIDVLRNVPQVEVDGDNNVSLRGNQNVTVQINGRPTPLKGQQLGQYLAQLPANLVAKVDVVTNPSAKNDPDGTAGIINITLTQRTDLGTSGGLSAATSTTGLANLSGNVARQKGRWTTSANYGFFRDGRSITGSSDRFEADPAANVLYAAGAPVGLYSTNSGRGRPLFHNGTLRGEYKFAPHDVVAADAVINTGSFTRSNDAAFTAVDGSGTTTARFAQLTNLRYTQTTGDYALAWRHTVDPQKNALSLELRYNDAQTGACNYLTSRAFLLNDAPDPGALVRPTRDLNQLGAGTWRLQSDWTKDLGANTKLETGVLGIRRRATSGSESAVFYGGVPLGAAAGSDGFAPDLARDNSFLYRERVASVYGVLTKKPGPWELQGGLRLERAALTFDLTTPNGAQTRHFDNGYQSAFPSALIAYNFDPKRQAKVSYSRRISRPDPGQLNPFEQREDAFNVFSGNPALRPEYTDSYELGYQHGFSKGSVQLSPYFRHTPDAVRFVRTVDTAGVTRSTFANVANTDQYGTDVNLSLRLGRLTGFGGGSVFRTNTDARNVSPDVSFRGAGWTARGNATYKLTPALDVQAFAFYRAPQPVEGGRLERFFMSTFALKQKLRGDQQTVTLRAQDPFNTMAWNQRTVSNGVVQVTDRHFGARALSLTYNYTFGKPPSFQPRRDEGQQAPAGGAPGGGPPG